MLGLPTSVEATHIQNKSSYGWVIVAIGATMLMMTYGIMYGYSVFFKPIQSYFGWDRSTVSAVYSVFLFIRGAAGIGVGWVMNRYGPVKIAVFTGALTGLGLILTSRVNELWQLFLTYGLIEAIGLSGSFVIATSVTSSWFDRNRGLALGIVSSGVGLGLLLVPASERLISTFNWQTAFIIIGSLAAIILMVAALFIRPYPHDIHYVKHSIITKSKKIQDNTKPEITLKTAFCSFKFMTVAGVFFMFVFCLQMVMVHLVNYATDMGVSPLVAASFISIIGVVSIGGRILMGIASDRIGCFNSLIICCILLMLSLIWLLFSHTTTALYIFAVIFGFAYGGEVPLIPISISHICGTGSMSTLVGLVLFLSNIGGALGPWIGGLLFDILLNYQFAFIIAIAVSFSGIALALTLKKYDQHSP